ncbi:hypothetical protein N7516_007132 [Penicillium verrucosum]|uniref:uncharacterized protein n=1 Tax=Penicillium verrucosum TaxID=60171 RepID=UPI0025453F71|nr:uncharacterized protein N7516_007132 [Penicillium verrucosum]KAJ5932643.1 hypothetical protein N7516_007132 [Penicillium verrucosum]
MGDDLRVTLVEVPRKQITPSTYVGEKEDSSSRRNEYMPMPVSYSIAKRDTLTLGPLVTIPDDFLNCPSKGRGKNSCVIYSIYGTKVSDSDDSKRDVSSLFVRDDDSGSCPIYLSPDSGKCYDTDSFLFDRASDPQEPKKISLSFYNNNKKFIYLRYPRCNAKNDGPTGVAKWYLPEFMLSSSQDINDNRRCSAKTTKENSVKGANNVYLIDGNSKLPAKDFRTEHVFEVHLVKHFLEWVCGGKESKYGGLGEVPFPKKWTRPDSTWCSEVFGGKKARGVQHTAEFLGNGQSLDLLVMYHEKPNGVKEVITEGRKSSLPKDDPSNGYIVEPKEIADKVMMTATVWNYLQEFSDKWTKPNDTPRGLKHWGLRTLWAYWIDNHLAKIEQIQADWHKTAKDQISSIKDKTDPKKIDAVAKKFADTTMTTGDAAVGKFKFPTSNAGKPLPGTATSASNDESKYGMWGGNQLGKLGL